MEDEEPELGHHDREDLLPDGVAARGDPDLPQLSHLGCGQLAEPADEVAGGRVGVEQGSAQVVHDCRFGGEHVGDRVIAGARKLLRGQAAERNRSDGPGELLDDRELDCFLQSLLRPVVVDDEPDRHSGRCRDGPPPLTDPRSPDRPLPCY